MKLFKGLIFIWFAQFILSACSSGGSESGVVQSLKEINLSGTWQANTEIKEFNKSTGEYLSSLFLENTVLMEDTNDGVLFSECQNYDAGGNIYGTKSDTHFYKDSFEDGYKFQADGSLKQISINEYDSSPGSIYERTTTLKKISNDIELDNGTLVLDGPVSVEEYSHVCLLQHYSSTGTVRSLELSARYGSSYLSLLLHVEGDIAPGVYQYITNPATDSLALIAVQSDAVEFWDIVGSWIIGAIYVTVNIHEATGERVLGSFEFTGQYDTPYTGEFEILF